MSQEATTGKVLLFGVADDSGATNGGYDLNETLEWDNGTQTWSQKSPTTSPLGSFAHPATGAITHPPTP
ncbi:MAG: hypothetical protein M3N12_06380, partial [Verrucomicrobiota bacterium]|nr:hypothetical protein [Verrucomicrobiota bacterium]